MEPARGERDDAVDVDVDGGGDDELAAMEPARGERDDHPVPGKRAAEGVAAMEPARGERDDLRPLRGYLRLPGPQWSPLVVSGMTVLDGCRVAGEFVPQWSPLVVSGMTS